MNSYVVYAYGAIWVGFFAYVARLGVKISRLEKEIGNLEK